MSDSPSPHGPESITQALKAQALAMGFDLVGIAPAVAPPGYPSYLKWLGDGRAAGMDYLHRQAEARRDPNAVLNGVRSIVMTAISYHSSDDHAHKPGQARIARYARGLDYHDLFWRRLEALGSWLSEQLPDTHTRAVCDTAPLLERDYARLAGLGWFGKNTMLIHKRRGSYLLLGALLTDADLKPDEPHATSHCGRCTACLDICPTDAFTAPYQLDARRCISYWTIEHRGPIPPDEANSLHGWVFGCDLCQEVCPWNRKAEPGRESTLVQVDERLGPNLLDWFDLSEAEFQVRLRGSAMKRTKRAGLLRNAAHVLGADRVSEAVPVLSRAAVNDEEDPVVRNAAIRALAVIDSDDARALLQSLDANSISEPLARAALDAALGQGIPFPERQKDEPGGPPSDPSSGVRSSGGSPEKSDR